MLSFRFAPVIDGPSYRMGSMNPLRILGIGDSSSCARFLHKCGLIDCIGRDVSGGLTNSCGPVCDVNFSDKLMLVCSGLNN